MDRPPLKRSINISHYEITYSYINFFGLIVNRKIIIQSEERDIDKTFFAIKDKNRCKIIEIKRIHKIKKEKQ
jgi:hypothetical protein